MAIIKCKMCGGTLEVNTESVAACEYCGTQQTLPKLGDERRANLYDRANHFRRNNEFDKAMGIYEQILNEEKTDAEAYWSLVLCRYGIEYVEDPASRKRVPTVNRAQFTAIFDDDNYKSALQYADVSQRRIYEEEAAAINEIQKGILAISQQEDPFDVFICYKETDNNGRRTPDSVLAADLYHQLTQEGFKVFFSRITLEDKLGQEYEPHIFAALNSAKVMVVLGTKPEYFNAVWVKNEWSRYLALIKQGQKKLLIPAYKDMDPYDIPEEFSHLQAQDMSKLGFMQDLIRGIKKIVQLEAPEAAVKEIVVTGGVNVAPLLKRVFMFLEDADWDSADEYCEKVLDIDPENAQAYLGKTLAQEQCKTLDAFVDKRIAMSGEDKLEKKMLPEDSAHIQKMIEETSIDGYLDGDIVRKLYKAPQPYYSTYSFRKERCAEEERYWDNHRLLSRAEKFGQGELAQTLNAAKERVLSALRERVEQAEAAEKKLREDLQAQYAAHLADADKKAAELRAIAEERREADYQVGCKKMASAQFPGDFMYAADYMASIGDYKDCKQRIETCRTKAKNMSEAEKQREEQQQAATKEYNKKLRKVVLWGPIVLALIGSIPFAIGVIEANDNPPTFFAGVAFGVGIAIAALIIPMVLAYVSLRINNQNNLGKLFWRILSCVISLIFAFAWCIISINMIGSEAGVFGTLYFASYAAACLLTMIVPFCERKC